MDHSLFSSPPFAGAAPSAEHLLAIGSMAAGQRVSGRVSLMNAVGSLLGVPAGGWSKGQSRLFVGGDVRLVGLLRRFLGQIYCRSAAVNLARARQYVNIDVMLVLSTAAREASGSIDEAGSNKIDSWREGGLDFLWKQKEKLGLPKAVTSRWERVPEFVSPETGNVVSPAKIPAQDQVLAYAAQINSSFERSFLSAVDRFFGGKRSEASLIPRPAAMIWKAYSFLAPGGAQYKPNNTVAAQSGQPFGILTALQFLAHRYGTSPTAEVLGKIATEAELNNVEWIRIAKARAAEALFLERLWRTSSELLRPSF